MGQLFDPDRFARRPLVGILRGLETEFALKAALAVAEGGWTNLEVTLNTPGAIDQIERLVDALGDRVNIGAGTIRTVQDVHSALEAGATYIVTPMVDRQVVSACREAGVPALVGAFTPTEIVRAWDCGAAMVKVFPAGSLGPRYLRDLGGPLSDIPLMPTGGVTVDNLAEFHRSGARAFGVGSPLFESARVASQDWDWLRARAQAFVQAFEASMASLAPSGRDDATALAAILRQRANKAR